MKVLSLDTSTPFSVVSLSDSRGFQCGRRWRFDRGRSERLIPLIERVLEQARWSLDQVDCFGVGVGPGSFTGLRIGLSLIKGFCYALKKPAVGFSSLDAIAAGVPQSLVEGGPVCVAVDAKRDSVYGRRYEKSQRDLLLRSVSAAGRWSLEEFEDQIQRSLLFTGDALTFYAEKIRQTQAQARFVSSRFWYPTPEGLSRVASEEIKRKRFMAADRVQAVYLYAHDCQVRPRQGEA